MTAGSIRYLLISTTQFAVDDNLLNPKHGAISGAVIDKKLCSLSRQFSDAIQSGQQTGVDWVDELLSTRSTDSNATNSGGNGTLGYGFDISAVVARLYGGSASVGIWGDNGNYGYIISAGPVLGSGASGSVGMFSSLNYSNVRYGFRVMAGTSVPKFPEFEVGGGSQFSNLEFNRGQVLIEAAYVGVQYVNQRTCSG